MGWIMDWIRKGGLSEAKAKNMQVACFLARGRIPAHLTAPRRGVDKCATDLHPALPPKTSARMSFFITLIFPKTSKITVTYLYGVYLNEQTNEGEKVLLAEGTWSIDVVFEDVTPDLRNKKSHPLGDSFIPQFIRKFPFELHHLLHLVIFPPLCSPHLVFRQHLHLGGAMMGPCSADSGAVPPLWRHPLRRPQCDPEFSPPTPRAANPAPDPISAGPPRDLRRR